jgi:hypothetical protein
MNGRFVEAKQEKRWLALRPLWSDPVGRFGSVSIGREPDLDNGDVTLKISDLQAATRLAKFRPLRGVRWCAAVPLTRSARIARA